MKRFIFSKLQVQITELQVFGIAAILLAIPAFFINLGITPLIEDEAIRSLVAFEMDQSGNYMVPTVGGSLYFNKPPLFNWIILPFFKIGGFNELMLRIPVVLSLLLFGLTIFFTVRKHVNDRIAFTTALLFVTCGRIITYESLKGLIDIIFSWVLFSNFMVLYNGIKNGKYFKSFLVSYLLLVIAFMLKGLPAVVFQAITVLTLYFIHFRWKMFTFLLSPKHLSGLIIFFVLIAVYYLAYLQYNPGSFKEMSAVVFQQSTKRTIVEFGLATTLKHLFLYPLEFFGHFAPWTLLVIYVFTKRGRLPQSQTFIQSCFWVFLLNLLVYWTSPQSYARYVLMLIPMFYIVLIFYYEKNQNIALGKVLYFAFFIIILIVGLATLALPFFKLTNVREAIWVKALFLFLSTGIIGYFYFKQPKNMIIYAGLFILVLRIAFDWFVLTHRVERMEAAFKKAEAINVGVFARKNELYVYGQPHSHFDEDKHIKQITFFSRYYISVQAIKIIRDTTCIIPGAYYLASPQDIIGKEHEKQHKLKMNHDLKPRFIVQFAP